MITESTPLTLKQHYEFKQAAQKLKQLNSLLSQDDPDTVTHQKRVAGSASILGRKLRLTQSHMAQLNLAALSHDIGKQGMKSIIHKKTELTPEEIALIRSHPEITRDIMQQHNIPPEIVKIALQHHMRSDSGSDLISQILQITDIGDSLIGGAGSGHDYPMKFFDDNGQKHLLPRTTNNILRVMDAAARKGEINKDIYPTYREMLVNKQLPKAQVRQLQIADSQSNSK
jgi:putative nucleotidyltransferase with HDIG domain